MMENLKKKKKVRKWDNLFFVFLFLFLMFLLNCV